MNSDSKYNNHIAARSHNSSSQPRLGIVSQETMRGDMEFMDYIPDPKVYLNRYGPKKPNSTEKLKRSRRIDHMSVVED